MFGWRFGVGAMFLVLQSMYGVVPTYASSTNDFYFDDFTGDYYLSRDKEGVSHLRVVEQLTAVFPEYEQNKGILEVAVDANPVNVDFDFVQKNGVWRLEICGIIRLTSKA